MGGEACVPAKPLVARFQSTARLAEAAAKTTENPLQKIDAALAQVDALRVLRLGAVQNRFNSLSPARGVRKPTCLLPVAVSKIPTHTEESQHVSRGFAAWASTSVLAQASGVPQERAVTAAFISFYSAP